MTEAAAAQAAPTLARYGLWTPWAEVLCLPCDYEVHADQIAARGRERAADPGKLLTAAEYYGDRIDAAYYGGGGGAPATCDRCQAACWVRHAVTLLQRLRFALGEATWDDDTIPGAELRQTGGMCSALVLTVHGREIVATDAEGERTPEGLYLGVYADEEWTEAIADHEVASVAEAVAWFVAQAKAAAP